MEKIPLSEGLTPKTLIRVKTDPNGDYRLISEAEFKELEESGVEIIESYQFDDVKEENGKLTGVNYGGDRVVIEE